MEEKKDDNRPILVQFENGILKDEVKGIIEFKYLRSKVPKSNKRMLLADTGSLTYVGSIAQKQQSLVKYYIGVVDKKSKKIEEIELCQLCMLKPKLREDEPMKQELAANKTFREKTDVLVEAFGTAKQKRLLSARKKNESAHETISDKVATVARKILAESPTKPKTPEFPSSGEMQIFPPMNKEAKQVHDIFHIDDIISFQDYQYLKAHARDMMNCNNEVLQTWKRDNKYPGFILHHLSQLPISSLEREERACYLCYLNFLITAFKLSYKDIQKKDPCPAIPNPLKRSILDKFTYSENGRNRCVPKKYKDKLLCYILVLALIIEEYEMNCNLLMKDLKLGVARLQKLLRAIGCSVRTTNTRKRKSDEDIAPVEPSVIAVLTTSKPTIVKILEETTDVNIEHIKQEQA